ncbi:sortase A [Nocardioides aromaticivorans]|uniref:Sortase n=1 Tax=Nocardioides aromaticivorans TaxID=200618 RepID=A0A7Y9ZK68_9ACTN|nr:sortase [Nocardioides aromaticivorans]NYI46989.1 sortase A [Nocardioides aromaticivorans]QSR26142.1 sortase [Nocardioides aromaticivorans]
MSDPTRTLVHDGEVDASPPPGRAEEHIRIAGGRAMLALSLLLGWFLLYLLVLSDFEQNHAQNVLYGELRTQLAEGTAPTGAPVRAGAPVALLDIPSLDVDSLVVVEGTRSRQLQDGPGHRPGTVLPGQQGVSVVAGRSTSYGRPFADLPDIERGAEVVVTTAQGRFEYVVSGIRVDGDPMPAPPGDGASRLILVTSSGSGSRLARLQPSHTVYVDAELRSGAAAAGPRSSADPEPTLLEPHVDRLTLAELALALQVLLGALAAFVWAWSRWSRRAAWIAGAPAVVAALWLVSSIGARLLPALI